MSELAEEGVIEQIDEEVIEDNKAVEDGSAAPVEVDEEIVDEIEISIGDESLTSTEEDESTAPAWVKEVRNSNRELKKENRQYKKELADYKTSMESNSPAVGNKPTLEQFDYDEDKYEEALTSYHDRKRTANEELKVQQSEIDEQNKAWNSRLDDYETAKGELKVKNFVEAEEAVLATLNTTQQGILVQGAENAALLVYAIGRNPKRAEELSKIKDPVKFAFAVARLEKDLKVTKKRPTPPPEGKITGSANSSGSASNSHLEKLYEEANKTGSLTKVRAYKKQMKNKS